MCTETNEFGQGEPPRSLAVRLLAFGFAGLIGFVIDVAVLTALTTYAGLNPFAARVMAIAVAAGCTWFVNRSFTFAPVKRIDGDLAREGGRYGVVAFAAAAINWCVYSLTLLVLPDLPPVIAAVVGSLVAMTFSYQGYSRFAFGRGGAWYPSVRYRGTKFSRGGVAAGPIPWFCRARAGDGRTADSDSPSNHQHP